MAQKGYRRPIFACKVDGCDRDEIVGRQGFCGLHYHRFYRYGDPLLTKRASSNPGKSAAVRKAHVVQYKLEKGCADCGYNAHHAALDFDHRPGTIKVRDIKSGQQLGWDALMEEIAKCDVVCANCHRIRTYERAREVMTMDTESLGSNV